MLNFQKGAIHLVLIVFGLLALTIFASASISARHRTFGRPLSSWICNSFPTSQACQGRTQRPSPQPPQPQVAPGGSFPYAVQAGTGGIIGGNITINGHVYSNADIGILGVGVTNPSSDSDEGNVDKGKPDDENDPHKQQRLDAEKQRCNRSTASVINGNMWAVGKINCAFVKKVSGNTFENQPSKPLPAVNIEYFKAQAAAGGTTSEWRSSSLGPIKIEGDLRLHGTAGESINVTGPVHVTGNVLIENVGLIPNPSLGSKGAVIVVDGKIDIEHGARISTTSSTPKGFIMLVSTSSNPSPGGNIPIERACAIKATPEQTQANINAILYAPNGSVCISGGTFVFNPNDTLSSKVEGKLRFTGAIAGKGIWYLFSPRISYDADVQKAILGP